MRAAVSDEEQLPLWGDDGSTGRLAGPKGRTFTEEQSAAIRARAGGRLLYANAGSGKTAVIVERFVLAVLQDGIDPRRILAITFTEKAAGELRERLRERLLELGERGAARAAEGAHVSTIHGFCARLLRAHPFAAGLDPDFRVLDEAEGRRLRDDAFSAALAGFLDSAARSGPAALELAAAYRPDRLAKLIGSTHTRLRSRGHTAPSSRRSRPGSSRRRRASVSSAPTRPWPRSWPESRPTRRSAPPRTRWSAAASCSRPTSTRCRPSWTRLVSGRATSSRCACPRPTSTSTPTRPTAPRSPTRWPPRRGRCSASC